VTHLGRTHLLRGSLVRDPAVVADAFNQLLATGIKPSLTGLRIPTDHIVTAEDVVEVDRVLIRFEPA
jgi:hypothetical protein